MKRIQILDSHTGGEPTRLVVGGFPDLGAGSMAERRERLAREHDAWRAATVLEPRGSDVVVGALAEAQDAANRGDQASLARSLKRVGSTVIQTARDIGVDPKRLSRIHETAAVGPGGRRYANAVLLAETKLSAPELLHALKAIERDFGRRGGRAWGARVLDLDIIALGDAAYRWGQRRGLTVPHRAMHRRRFVLDPLLEVAPGWRHPALNLTARQLHARLTSRRPASISPREGP